jgi:excisionase family DNA binding protein
MTLEHFEPTSRPGFLTTEEVLGYLRVNPRTIYRLIHRGELPAVRVGRQWRFRQSDLDDWLDRQRLHAVWATGPQRRLARPAIR